MPPPPPAPPLTRAGEVRRLVAAVLGGALLWVGQVSDETRTGPLLPLVDAGLGLVVVVAMHWRRRWPGRVALLATLATTVSAASVVAWMICFVSLVTTRRWRAIVPVAALSVLVTYVYDRLRPTSGAPLPWWVLLVISVLLTAVLLVVGLYRAARRDLRRERAEVAEREQAARVEDARRGERARIAREMHDVLAHRISLVSLHAGAMTYRTDLTADELRGTARVVEDNARQALVDLRDVLGLLRDPTATGGGTTPPQPTLADLPDLVREAQAAGTPVELRRSLPDLAAVPETIGRTAYRVVQEALTNARKHAPGTAVVLEVGGAPGSWLVLQVHNRLLRAPVVAGARAAEPTVAAGAVPGAGMGLIGLTERVSLAGGALEHGPTPEQEYRVSAWLPWPA